MSIQRASRIRSTSFARSVNLSILERAPGGELTGYVSIQYAESIALPSTDPYHQWETRWLSKPDTYGTLASFRNVVSSLLAEYLDIVELPSGIKLTLKAESKVNRHPPVKLGGVLLTTQKELSSGVVTSSLSSLYRTM